MTEHAIINCLSVKIFKANRLKHFLLLGRSRLVSLYPVDKESVVLFIKEVLESARLDDQAFQFKPIAFKSSDDTASPSSISSLAHELADVMPSNLAFLTTGSGSLELSFHYGNLDLLFTLSRNPFTSICPILSF